MVTLILLLVYSCFLRIVFFPIATLFRSMSDRLDTQLDGRSYVGSAKFRMELAAKRRNSLKCFVFFCSSAGEYEQAKPVLERLEEKGIFTHTFFFSRSGLDFAKIRHENLSYSLCPLDYVWTWASIFAALRPTGVVVVRHEFWPSFLLMARKWSKIYVLNGVPPAMLGREPKIKTAISSAFKKMLLGPNAMIFTSDHDGTSYYQNNVGYSSNQVTEIGDTKFDRVIERIEHIRPVAISRVEKIATTWLGTSPILILGSAHMPDLQFLLEAFSNPITKGWRLLVVPHDLSSKNISQMHSLLIERGIKTEWYNEIEVLALDNGKTDCRAIIVDSMGLLSELYGLADLAWVGGAIHAKVHNVLEPAVWGLPITCGPRFQNSQEAKILDQAKLLIPIARPSDVVKVWSEQLEHKQNYKDRLDKKVSELLGASERFVSFATNHNS